MSRTFEEEKSKPVASTKNEFTEIVTELAENREKVVSYPVSAATRKEALDEAASDKRLMATAGNALPIPVTVKTRREWLTDEKSKVQTVKVFMWVADKIKRKSSAA
jgi:hypothetical protein